MNPFKRLRQFIFWRLMLQLSRRMGKEGEKEIKRVYKEQFAEKKEGDRK